MQVQECGTEKDYLHCALLDSLFLKEHYYASFLKGQKFAWENPNRHFKDGSEECIYQNYLESFCFFDLGFFCFSFCFVLFAAVVCYFKILLDFPPELVSCC